MASTNAAKGKISPVGRLSMASYRPFGGSTAVNVLPQFLGTPEIVTNVMFLGCGDMRNVLATVAKMTEAYPKLEIHLSDDYSVTLAGNILITHIMLSANFKPSNPVDMDYLWDLWYSSKWTDSTLNRFVCDVETLLSLQWNTVKHIVLEEEDVEEMKKIFSSWLKTASDMTITTVISTLNERNEVMFLNRFLDSELWESPETSKLIPSQHLSMINRVQELWPREPERGRSLYNLDLYHLDKVICDGLRINLPSLIHFKNVNPDVPAKDKEEIRFFLKTGNFEPVVGSVKCLNPTLLLERRWKVHHLSSPFVAFFPIPLDEQLKMEQDPESINSIQSPYLYCKSKLKSLVIEFRARKHRIVLNFHVKADSIKLCMQNEKLQNKFQVIHCSNLLDVVGLANLLPAVTGCLIQEDPTAVLLAESTSWDKLKQPTVAEYVELALACPLSMVPTLYGVRLANHLLGSSVCVNLHGFGASNPITLKWLRVPGYSSNVQLAVSEDLKAAISRLASLCFIQSGHCTCKSPIPCIVTGFLFPYTPLTFWYVLQSLAKNYQWIEGALEPLYEPDSIPASLRLAWRTQRAWMSGKQVLRFSSCDFYISDSILAFLKHQKNYQSSTLLLMPHEEVVRQNAVPDAEKHLHVRKIFACSHSIDHLWWDETNSSFTQVEKTSFFGDPSNPAISFLLPMDHGVDTKAHLSVYDGYNMPRFLPPFFKSFEAKVAVNPNPSSASSQQRSEGVLSGLQVVNALESNTDYQLQISIVGTTINNINDVIVKTDQLHPALSAHEITLTLTDAEPLIFRVPWPIVVGEIKLSLHKKKKKNWIQLVLKKSVNEPWPSSFGGRSKWDMSKLPPWKDLVSNGSLSVHLGAQYDWSVISKWGPSIRGFKPSTVREFMQGVLTNHFHHPFTYLFAVHYQSSRNPAFGMRVQPPVRFTPDGSPLLLVSVVDFQVVFDLMIKGKLEEESFGSEFHRIITEGVSRPVGVFELPDEEVELLRYVLRLNSTRMRRSAWQSKNLPRGENSPWLPTFISPVYAENINPKCNCDKKKEIETTNELFDSFMECQSCHVKRKMFYRSDGVDLKQCSRCTLVSYCSVECQKKDWPIHKSTCGSSPFET